jgi:phospholipid-transporting ATPase
VPISLLVTLEIVKFIQAQFIALDATIFDETKDMPTKAQSSNLNEELGQVEYIFSDKTGTLTQNIMEFKKMCIGPKTYGKSDEAKKEYLQSSMLDQNDIDDNTNDNPDITNVNFFDPGFYKEFNDPSSENHEMIDRFMTHLALCHTVIIETKETEDREVISYNAR